jgi:hypothetical protein
MTTLAAATLMTSCLCGGHKVADSHGCLHSLMAPCPGHCWLQSPCGPPVKPGCSVKWKDFWNSGCKKDSCKVGCRGLRTAAGVGPAGLVQQHCRPPAARPLCCAPTSPVTSVSGVASCAAGSAATRALVSAVEKLPPRRRDEIITAEYFCVEKGVCCL